MTIHLNELLEKAMKKCDSTMKETIEDYLFLRKEASDDLDELRQALEFNDALGLCQEVFSCGSKLFLFIQAFLYYYFFVF